MTDKGAQLSERQGTVTDYLLFLSLPAETRNTIYELCEENGRVDDSTIGYMPGQTQGRTPNKRQYSARTQVNQQIRAEYLPIYTARTQVNVPFSLVPEYLEVFCPKILGDLRDPLTEDDEVNITVTVPAATRVLIDILPLAKLSINTSAKWFNVDVVYSYWSAHMSRSQFASSSNTRALKFFLCKNQDLGDWAVDALPMIARLDVKLAFLSQLNIVFKKHAAKAWMTGKKWKLSDANDTTMSQRVEDAAFGIFCDMSGRRDGWYVRYSRSRSCVTWTL